MYGGVIPTVMTNRSDNHCGDGCVFQVSWGVTEPANELITNTTGRRDANRNCESGAGMFGKK